MAEQKKETLIERIERSVTVNQPIEVAKLREMVEAVETCGDVPGHEFHGNQYTGGGGGQAHRAFADKHEAEHADSKEAHERAASYHQAAAMKILARPEVKDNPTKPAPQAYHDHIAAANAHFDAAAQGDKNPAVPRDPDASSKANKASQLAHSGRESDPVYQAKRDEYDRSVAKHGAENAGDKLSHNAAQHYHDKESRKGGAAGVAHAAAAEAHAAASALGHPTDSEYAREASRTAHAHEGLAEATAKHKDMERESVTMPGTHHEALVQRTMRMQKAVK